MRLRFWMIGFVFEVAQSFEALHLADVAQG